MARLIKVPFAGILRGAQDMCSSNTSSFQGFLAFYMANIYSIIALLFAASQIRVWLLAMHLYIL